MIEKSLPRGWISPIIHSQTRQGRHSRRSGRLENRGADAALNDRGADKNNGGD